MRAAHLGRLGGGGNGDGGSGQIGKGGGASGNGGAAMAIKFYAPSTQHQSFSDSSLWMPQWLARKNASLGPKEKRHALHAAVAAVANVFMTRALDADRGARDEKKVKASPPLVTAEDLLQASGEADAGVLRPAVKLW